MLTVFKSFTFTLNGNLPGEEVLTGIIRDQEGQARLVAIALTSNMSESSRRKKISVVRDVLNAFSKAFPKDSDIPKGWLKLGFLETAPATFSPPLTAKIKNPSFIPQTVEMILQESAGSQIVFDCQSKESFWAICRYFDLDENVMFALADMEKLKPVASEVTQTKSAGTAHILATWLSRREGDAARHFEQRIRQAVKFKLPDFDQSINTTSAQFETDYSGHKERALASRSLTGIAGRMSGKISRWAESKLPDDKKHEMRERLSDKFASGTYYDPRLSQDERDALFRKKWETRMKMPLEAIQFPQAITEIAQDSDGTFFEKFRLKPGRYDLPYQHCLFELDITRGADANGPAERFHFYVLADQNGHEITFTPIMKPEGDGTYMFGRDYTVDTTPGQNMSWRVFDHAVGEVEVQEHGLDYNIYSCAIISAMNVVARFNEPDFEDSIVTPTGGAVGKSMGRSPYFQYHVIEDYPEFYRSRSVTSRSDESGVHGNVIRHLVRGHLRRIPQPDGGMEITYVTSHARGDETKGFKMPAWKLDKK